MAREIHDAMERPERLNRLRTRLPGLLGTWLGAAVAEVVLYYFFLSRPYFRTFFAPFAVGIALLALAWTWRVMRGRSGEDRRLHERRTESRRLRE
jgi:hypothetical protein